MSFCFLILALIVIIVSGPATGYEFSIYNAYPWYFWTCLFAAILSGQILIIRDILDFSESRGWIFGGLSIILSNTVLLFLPLIRGYHNSGTGDVLTHLGFMNNIINSGSVGIDQYPIDHILGVLLHFITSISLPEITMIIPPIFSIFFILSILLLGRVLIPDKKYALLFLSFGSILYFQGYNNLFAPNAQAMLLLPLILYLIIKISQVEKTKENILLLLTISILIVFFHPLVTIICILIYAIIRFLNIVQQKILHASQSNLPLEYLIFVMFCFFSIWSTIINSATRTVEPIISSLIGVEDQVSQFDTYSSSIGSVSVDYWYLTKLAINVYGQFLIIGILSIVCIGIIFVTYRKKLNQIPFLVPISILGYIFFTIFSVILFFVSGKSFFIRIIRISMIFSLILIPYGSYVVLKSERINFEKSILFVIILLLSIFSLTFFSTNNLFDSPIIKESNQQVLNSDYQGLNTFFTFRDDSISTLENGISSFRFYDAQFGQGTPRTNIFYGELIRPVDHFGYNTNISLSKRYNNKYLILTNRGIFTYQNIYPEFPKSWRFTPSDFMKLKTDKNVQQFYQNGNLQIFQIVP